MLASADKGWPIASALAGVAAVAFPPHAAPNSVGKRSESIRLQMRIALYIRDLLVPFRGVEQGSRPWTGVCVAVILLSWTGAGSAQADALTIDQDVPPESSAPLETGREWLARCRALAASEPAAVPNSAGNGRCLGWVEGLIDINEIYRGLGALEKTSEGFCMPPAATVQAAANAITAYLDEHPSVLHFSARILAYMALRRAFPCGAFSSAPTGDSTISIP